MSHSYGEVWSPEGQLLGHFEYNGTVDICCARIHPDEQGVADNWRADNWRLCECGGSGQPVIIWSSYGHGFHWSGRACMACMAITEGRAPEDSTDGHPFFDAWMQYKFGRSVPCPECGGTLRTDGDAAPIRCDQCNAGLYEWNLEPK